MICFFTRTYSVSRAFSGNSAGEYVGTGLIILFRMFSEMPASMRWLRSSGLANGCASITTGGRAATAVVDKFTGLLTAAVVVVASMVIAWGTSISRSTGFRVTA